MPGALAPGPGPGFADLLHVSHLPWPVTYPCGADGGAAGPVMVWLWGKR